MNLHDVVATLSALSQELDTVTAQLISADEDMVYAQQEERQSYARCFMELDGSIELRKQQAILDTSQEKLDSELAEQKVRAARARIKYLELSFEAARSINAARRAEFVAEPLGQYT